VVFTSGGVGPTHDDLTIEGVARGFGVRVVVAAEIEGLIRRYYGDRVTEGHLLMARVPDGARLVSSGAIPWPTVVMRNVWVLPGVPEVFQMKLPHVRAELGGGTPFWSLSVYTRLDEGDLKPMLDRVVAAHAEVEVGSYPKWHDPEYATKLTFDGLDESKVRAARDALVAELPAGALVRTE
jgi:molybdopterin-biosynthesis enzyme MoeA-like protein